MTEYFENLSSENKSKIKKAPFPPWCSPMLATLTDKKFSDSAWTYEPKFDGERALTFYEKGKIQVFSRNQINLNTTYPELVKTFENYSKVSFVVDGEIVAFDNEVTSFSKLQQRLGLKKASPEDTLNIPVYYYLFDILYINGYDVTQLPLKTRKCLLKEAIPFLDSLRFTEDRPGEGEAYYHEACQKGWEGIMAKRLDSPYQGKRSTDWLKFKCHKGQELIIIGYTAPRGKRHSFGALLAGYYNDKGKLCYAGKVGTGFNDENLIPLKKEMDKHMTSIPAIHDPISNQKNITWLEPILVGEFSFTEWTREGKLRHPTFKGLRYDKAAKDIIREMSQ